MSNLWINIRIGLWHVQCGPDRWLWVSRNNFHRGLPDGLFRCYRFFWWGNAQ